ncbi:hypothetical protein M569_12297 [Genlisea aurea]|uniref:Uncharacterized protein n=1 Tax=Genlisea aurea TaxID=192259 RepID=S8DI94_9LAMI|nr:hypothetical protein M569_12297 [Genlisea aurea]
MEKRTEVARIIESMTIPGVDDDTLLKATEAIMANENNTILFLGTSEALRVRMPSDAFNAQLANFHRVGSVFGIFW